MNCRTSGSGPLAFFTVQNITNTGAPINFADATTVYVLFAVTGAEVKDQPVVSFTADLAAGLFIADLPKVLAANVVRVGIRNQSGGAINNQTIVADITVIKASRGLQGPGFLG